MSHLSLRHWRLGWTFLTLFVATGLGLEALHGLKLGFYLDPDQALRRELWTLAHAHGALVALVHLGFATWLERRGEWRGASLVSVLLGLAVVLVPLGFFLGGLTPGPTDPGVGIWLVPLGGAALLLACGLVAARAIRPR